MMELSTKQQGGLWIVVGIVGILSRIRIRGADKQMNFDPVSGEEHVNEKATLLKRNLLMVVGACFIAYGFYLFVR
jgi:hypothetical protein